MAIKFDLKNLPLYAKIIIALLPGVILTLLVVIFLIIPKQKEIKALDDKIDKQINEIAESQAKVAKLPILIKKNEELSKRINELKEQLPEEKEISTLLKQVSDLGIGAGLVIKSWKPFERTLHSSGIVYEIPVSVSVTGTYHSLGHFLSSLTRLNRIVNIKNMKVGKSKKDKDRNTLEVSFTATTFSALSEEEVIKAAKVKKKRR